MSIEQSDAESAAVAKNQSGRVSLADIEAAINAKFFRTGMDCIADSADGTASNMDYCESLNSLTVCILVMHNGYTVVGKSAPADPSNFNADFGRKLAYEDAIRQLWPLMGFAKRNELAAQGA
jgi:hypothetical protein